MEEVTTRIVVIGCGKSKRSERAPAGELYTGSLFQACRRYAERADYWGILSAKHGFTVPTIPLAPYEQELAASKAGRTRWGQTAALDFGAAFSMRPLAVECLAGAAYADAFASELWFLFGVKVTQPLRGMGIGQRMAWLSREATRAA